ncbi:MAG: right-handed parallel beta-helix repeat-containing protein [Deltaproteobacteria bacterium]|nr:right-handed parallel beta-helix repeat-containing protein [Deltaproteobacteria bacterium]
MNLRRFSPLLGIALLIASSAAEAVVHRVHPGQSIQAAVDAASPGDTILVYPGTYQETHGGQYGVHVTTDNLRLIGRARRSLGEAGKVRLVPGPGQETGIMAVGTSPTQYLQRFYLRGFTVEGFSHHGIMTRWVSDFRIERNEFIDNLENGIFPILSANGMVRRNVSYGSLDTALWVGSVQNVRILNNELYDSPIGIEITNSTDVTVKRNDIHGNAVGIGLFHPNATGFGGSLGANMRVERNHIHDNNGPNNAPPGTFQADLPIGGGVLLLGVDEAVIRLNKIEDNDFYGVAIVDWCTAMVAGPESRNCTNDPPLDDPTPDNNLVSRNRLSGNATAPPAHPLALFAEEFIYLIGFPPPGVGNCFERNTYSTHFSTEPGGLLPVDGC